jgi:hypothetical protein
MIGTRAILRWLKLFWLSAWPLWTLVAFASLALVRLLPAGYSRAAVAVPVSLLVPGSLILGALFGQRRRPQGTAFVCYAVLLSVICSVFASLALYARHFAITADSTYWCLLFVSAALAIVAEARLVLGRGTGRRAARKPETPDPDLSDAEANDVPIAAGTGFYALASLVAGIGLLAGGLYAYDRVPHPAPAGYTSIAWTGPQVKGAIAIGSAGTKLGFQIMHHQSDTTSFRLRAVWLGSPSRPLARPLTVSIGPNRTFRGALFVPPLPDGCTYRIVVALSAARQSDMAAETPQTWAINADVHDPNKSAKKCK